jgi:hypothetical protein
MTEDEWLTCPTVRPLLRYLRRREAVPQPGRRRLRLFACACCRHLEKEGLAFDEPLRQALKVAEDDADGRLHWRRLNQACAHAEEARRGGVWMEAPAELAFAATMLDPGDAASRTADAAAEVYAWMCVPRESYEAARARVETAFVRYLRDIFGNPFRTVSVNPAWLRWHDRAVPKLARAFYDERAFDRLSVLADALEEAGCTDAGLLGHCRGPGPHAKGCWVVDLLLGKGWLGGGV